MSSIETLRAELDGLGVSYTNRMKEATLKKLLIEHQGYDPEAEEESPVLAQEEKASTKKQATSPAKTKSIGEMRKEATKLVRVIVRPNDPNKAEYSGDYFSIGNEVLGFITKFVPYNNEEGWHVPRILVDQIKAQQVQLWRTKKLSNGMDSKEGYLTNAYNVTELPPLTKSELEELARRQKEYNSVD